MDLRLPGISGVEAIEQLGLLAPASRVLVLTRSEENRVVEAIIAGASGYILKTAPPEAIIGAIKATAAGESVLSPRVAGKLLQRIRELDLPVKTSGSTATAIRAALTERELEIFTQLASGHSNQQIANDLSVSTNTVANHIASILAKLHLENRIQAAVQAVRSGISLPAPREVFAAAALTTTACDPDARHRQSRTRRSVGARPATRPAPGPRRTPDPIA